MADVTVVRCTCGAHGDEGEMVEHVISHLTNSEDKHPHGWAGEPERVAVTRTKMAEWAEYQSKLARATGLTVEQLRIAQRS